MIESAAAEAVAVLIAEIGQKGYGAAQDRLLAQIASFDMSCGFAYSEGSAPVVLHDGYSATVDRRALKSYLRGAYLLDPFYAASLSGHARGLWRMRDLAPDDFYASDFAWSSEVHPCISDQAGTLVEEIGFLIPLDDHFTATYSLMRNRGGEPFTEVEFEALNHLTPIVSASLRRHWEVISRTAPKSERHDSEAVFWQAFGELLTPTQHEVTKLILRGHSNLSISQHLGITEGTAKIHRSNIYRRLGISSQSELFQKFITCLTD